MRGSSVGRQPCRLGCCKQSAYERHGKGILNAGRAHRWMGMRRCSSPALDEKLVLIWGGGACGTAAVWGQFDAGLQSTMPSS